MSVASRARERIVRGRRGFPTFAAFREAQRAALASWVEPPQVTAERLAWRARLGLDTAHWDDVVYPEPINDSP